MKMHGSKKSTARSAPGENKRGNLGKAIGDSGCRTKKGNKKTRCAADRYK